MELNKTVKYLSDKYGPPVIKGVDLKIDKPFDPIADLTDRWGEVIFIVRRPKNKFLMVSKDWYPDGVFRFPSGGIRHGEEAENALFREVEEELGLKLPVERFLAVVNYRFSCQNGFVRHYSSFIFLFPEVKNSLKFLDTNEGKVELKDVNLQEVKEQIEKMQNVQGEMRDWSLFRAIALDTILPLLR